MLIKHDKALFIYFGNADDQLYPPYYLNLPNEPILSLKSFNKLKEMLHAHQLFFLHQTHSVDGVIIDKGIADTLIAFKQDGDYLITNLSHVAIGVMTADCLPLIIFDRVHKVVAVVHAGWRGTAQGIAIKALEQMAEFYNTASTDCDIFFGPCAKVCCYEVTADFKQNLAGYEHHFEQLLISRNNSLYFDLPRLNQIQLEAAGVKTEFLFWQNNLCTICDTKFFSYRRQKEDAGRQMTVVTLA